MSENAAPVTTSENTSEAPAPPAAAAVPAQPAAEVSEDVSGF